MSAPVFIAGVGVISAIGNNAAECLSALKNGQAGMGDMTYLDSIHRRKIPVAEVKLSNEELASVAGLSPVVKPYCIIEYDGCKGSISMMRLLKILKLR